MTDFIDRLMSDPIRLGIAILLIGNLINSLRIARIADESRETRADVRAIRSALYIKGFPTDVHDGKKPPGALDREVVERAIGPQWR